MRQSRLGYLAYSECKDSGLNLNHYCDHSMEKVRLLQTPFGYLEIAIVTLNGIIVQNNLLRTCQKVQTAGMEISGYMGTHLALETCIIIYDS